MTQPAPPEVRGDLAPDADDSAPGLFSASGVTLLVSNSLPLLGVLFFGWQVFPLLFLYWFENVVVGVMNVARMLTAQPASSSNWALKLFLVPFFCFHYGMFTMVHGIFVFALFGPASRAFFPNAAAVRSVASGTNGLVVAIVAIVSSHLFSFIWNYLRGGEYRRASPALLMAQPYARVMVMHVVVLGGAFAVAAIGSPLPALIILVVLKTGVDLAAHRAERVRFLTPGAMALLGRTA
ncbi:MAG: DUF6498-containing protein [Gemmatimonadota bacterium]|nr:DUF6498-containing protein [Gemmatimonadota bacterium]